MGRKNKTRTGDKKKKRNERKFTISAKKNYGNTKGNVLPSGGGGLKVKKRLGVIAAFGTAIHQHHPTNRIIQYFCCDSEFHIGQLVNRVTIHPPTISLVCFGRECAFAACKKKESNEKSLLPVPQT